MDGHILGEGVREGLPDPPPAERVWWPGRGVHLQRHQDPGPGLDPRPTGAQRLSGDHRRRQVGDYTMFRKLYRQLFCRYNFVLVNRYKDGNDKMGDHKDDEKELDPSVPIASLTFGAERDFIFKHQNKKINKIDDVKIILKDGMLLLMKNPTNSFWYHGLPQRKKCFEPRINLTFRKILKWKIVT